MWLYIFSGGIFHDCAVHDIDMVCWILEEFPNSVFTIAHAHNKEIEQLHDVDTVVIVMKFPSGVLSTIELSRNSSYGYDQRLEVTSSMCTLCGVIISTGVLPWSCTGVRFWWNGRVWESETHRNARILERWLPKSTLQILIPAAICWQLHRCPQSFSWCHWRWDLVSPSKLL